ncbi:11570_t:CDS:2, partial [Gigaspora rosea]
IVYCFDGDPTTFENSALIKVPSTRSIPFACPTSYHYIYNLSQLACQLRVINFIFMWLYFCSFMLLIIVNWYLQKHETNLESVDFGDIDRPKSFTTRSSASLKRRSSIRKGTLKTKGSKRLSQTGSSTSSRNSLEMSEIDENQKNNANNLKLQGVYPEHVVEVVHQDDVHSDEYVVYDSTDEMESILIKTDTD